MRQGIMNGALTLAAALVVSGAAFAQTMTDIEIKDRQAKFKDIGAQNKVISDQLKTASPDIAAITTAAAKIKTHSDALPTWFKTNGGSSLKTAAKPEIWSDAAGFATASKGFQDASAKLLQLAVAKDVEGLKAHQRTLGGACFSCHTKYREKQQ
jgi:cytochrome c556